MTNRSQRPAALNARSNIQSAMLDESDEDLDRFALGRSTDPYAARKSTPWLQNASGRLQSLRAPARPAAKLRDYSSSDYSSDDSPMRPQRKSQRIVETGSRVQYRDDDESDVSSDKPQPKRRLRKLKDLSDDEVEMISDASSEVVEVVKKAQERNGDLSSDFEEGPEEIIDEDRDIVEKIIAREKREGTWKFLVKLKGRSYMHARWEPESFFYDTEADKRSLKLKNFQAKLPKGVVSVPSFEEGSHFNPLFIRIERIIATRIPNDVLVKWEAMPYGECTWEDADTLPVDQVDAAMEQFNRLNAPERLTKRRAAPFRGRVVKPPTASDASEDFAARLSPVDDPAADKDPAKRMHKYGKLSIFDFQREGIQWLLYNWLQGRGSILADEMGLGKTVQTSITLQEMSLFCEKHRSLCGETVFLVVAPLSTLEQWKREISKWTNLEPIVFHGSDRDRQIISRFEFQGVEISRSRDPRFIRSPGLPKFDVCVTSYEMLSADPEIFQTICWTAIVLDESHKLKGSESRARQTVLSVPVRHRILLTGTPIQNSLGELWSLLNLCSGSVWHDKDAFLAEFGQLKSSTETEQLQRRIQPFLLQRKKIDVMSHLMPAKEETIITVELTRIQKETYKAIYEKNMVFLASGKATPQLSNVHMELRKCCNHPFLVSGIEEKVLGKAQLGSEEWMRRLVAASGKMVFLEKLIDKLLKENQKLLVFSQFTMVLDIIEDYLRFYAVSFERLDGAVDARSRQEAVDRFNRTPSATPSTPEISSSGSSVFLLSTKAGGVGLNLIAASVVLLFDHDWNPQNDLQAQARCHRIGQTREVKIFRLVTRGTYEEHMFRVASQKLGLEQAVMSNVGGKKDKVSAEEMERLLKEGAYAIFEDDENERKFCEAEIEEILNTRSTTVKEITETGSGGFSKAFFQVNEASKDVSVEDPDFWEKISKAGYFKSAPVAESEDLIIEGRRAGRAKFEEMSEESEDEPTPVKAKSSIDAKRMILISKFLAKCGLWENYETWEAQLFEFFREKWGKKAAKLLDAAMRIERSPKDDVVVYMAAVYRALCICKKAEDEVAFDEVACSSCFARLSPSVESVSFLDPIKPFHVDSFFKNLEIPEFVLHCLPSSDFKQLKSHVMQIEGYEQLRMLIKMPELPPAIEARKSRMQPDWWGSEDDRQLIECTLLYGRDDCSTKILDFPHFKEKLDDKFQKQFVLYRIDKLLPQWWQCRTSCVAKLLLSHGFPTQLIQRVFKASGYSWTRKFAQGEVLLSSISPVEVMKGSPGNWNPPAQVEEAGFWRELHAKLPAGFALNSGDVADFAKVFLYRILVSLGMKNEATHASVKTSLRISKANEELPDLKFPGLWPVEFTRDQAFEMIWRIQAMFYLKSGAITESDIVEHADHLLPLSTTAVTSLFTKADKHGLDYLDRAGLRGLLYAACKIMNAKAVLASASSVVEKRSREETPGESPVAKKGKQQSIKDMFKRKVEEE